MLECMVFHGFFELYQQQKEHRINIINTYNGHYFSFFTPVQWLNLMTVNIRKMNASSRAHQFRTQDRTKKPIALAKTFSWFVEMSLLWAFWASKCKCNLKPTAATTNGVQEVCSQMECHKNKNKIYTLIGVLNAFFGIFGSA